MLSGDGFFVLLGCVIVFIIVKWMNIARKEKRSSHKKIISDYIILMGVHFHKFLQVVHNVIVVRQYSW